MKTLLTALLLTGTVLAASDVTPLLRDPSPSVRQRALDKISADSKGKLSAMLAIAESVSDPDAAVRQHAVNAIASTGGIESVHLLRKLSQSKGEASGVKSAAQAGLRRLGAIPAEMGQWDKEAGNAVLIDGEKVAVPEIDLGFQSNGRGVMIASPKIGSFGRLTQAKVFQVIGPQSMLVDGGFFNATAERKVIRVDGYPTAELTDDAKWEDPLIRDASPKIVIVDTVTYRSTDGGTRTTVRAVPASKAMLGMSIEEFKHSK